MPKLFVYIMRYFEVPKFEGNACRFQGCKLKIEKNAKIGDWIIGIGGKDFHELKMIYAMKVEKTHPPKEKIPPPESNYFKNYKNNPLSLPNDLEYIIAKLKDRKNRRGYRCPEGYSKFDEFMRNQIKK